MNLKDICIECFNKKETDDESYFCNDCKKKIINKCFKFHLNLQDRYL